MRFEDSRIAHLIGSLKASESLAPSGWKELNLWILQNIGADGLQAVCAAHGATGHPHCSIVRCRVDRVTCGTRPAGGASSPSACAPSSPPGRRAAGACGWLRPTAPAPRGRPPTSAGTARMPPPSAASARRPGWRRQRVTVRVTRSPGSPRATSPPGSARSKRIATCFSSVSQSSARSGLQGWCAA
ncbi:relaxase/mobilization nuclease domain-containing protein [Thermaurantiacus tibetensis]|uniref:relaxase/mobilization nuclease domain-containing protein n=1 Tax=Thermaurantiacus tibetensis TaxID=2759035 RepID=UPI0038B5DE8D